MIMVKMMVIKSILKVISGRSIDVIDGKSGVYDKDDDELDSESDIFAIDKL